MFPHEVIAMPTRITAVGVVWIIIGAVVALVILGFIVLVVWIAVEDALETPQQKAERIDRMFPPSV